MKQYLHMRIIYFLMIGITPYLIQGNSSECFDTLTVASSINSSYYKNLNNAQLVSNTRLFFPSMGDPVNLATIAGNPGGQFGSALATNRDGSLIAVGAKKGGVGGTGVVYIFAQHFASWELVQVLTPSNGRTGDQFGHKITISGDGSTIIVGAPYAQNTLGNAYIFYRTGIHTWSELQILSAPTIPSNIGFGRALSISYDGRVIIVSAPGGELYDTPTKVGYVYSFIRTPNCNTTAPQWNFEQAFTGTSQVLAEFGASVSLNGDGSILAVGAPGFNYTVADEGGVFIYARYADDSGWSVPQLTFITPDPTITGALGSGVKFGSDVALSGDASSLFIGGPGFPANAANRQGTVFYVDRPIEFPSSQRLIQALNIPVVYKGLGSSISITHDGRGLITGPASDQNGGAISYFINASNANINGRKAPIDTSYIEAQDLRPLSQAKNFASVCALSRDGGYCIGADPDYLGVGIAMVYRGIGASLGQSPSKPTEQVDIRPLMCPKQQSVLPLYAVSALLLGYCCLSR